MCYFCKQKKIDMEQVLLIMKNKGITKASLSEKLGIKNQNFNAMLKNPTYDTLCKIATALDVPMWQLFASPEEVAKESDGKVCPYCGGLIDVSVELKKKG